MERNDCPAVMKNPAICGGEYIFGGSRVPVRSLFDNLRDGATVHEFVQWFPVFSMHCTNTEVYRVVPSEKQVAPPYLAFARRASDRNLGGNQSSPKQKKIPYKHAHGPIISPNSNTPLVRSHFLKTKGGIKGILSPQPIVFSSELPDFLGQGPI